MDVNILAIIYLVPMNVAVVKGTSKLENITAKVYFTYPCAQGLFGEAISYAILVAINFNYICN